MLCDAPALFSERTKSGASRAREIGERAVMWCGEPRKSTAECAAFLATAGIARRTKKHSQRAKPSVSAGCGTSHEHDFYLFLTTRRLRPVQVSFASQRVTRQWSRAVQKRRNPRGSFSPATEPGLVSRPAHATDCPKERRYRIEARWP